MCYPSARCQTGGSGVVFWEKPALVTVVTPLILYVMAFRASTSERFQQAAVVVSPASDVTQNKRPRPIS